ncbi:hypothetical protein G168_gp28 [Lactobacillus phage ATCC8014]|uniref:Uncharacterized protein n=1 Tax=Lactobacillus phage ATCC8014 TaxID=2892340 RepID=K4I483_9CAUD|nr:hypothetical protein G168_gp28 [Lactobacillus phage ATCC8014]AFU63035.1 hypothetical protein 8014-B1_0028 [Lactobacillus phage ATCC8014]
MLIQPVLNSKYNIVRAKRAVKSLGIDTGAYGSYLSTKLTQVELLDKHMAKLTNKNNGDLIGYVLAEGCEPDMRLAEIIQSIEEEM